MNEQLKKRLIGAVVLISLAVIFLPMLLENEPTELEHMRMKPIPEPPVAEMKPVPEPQVVEPVAEVSQPQPVPVEVNPEPVQEPAKAPATPPTQKKPEPAPKPEPEPKAKEPALETGWVVQVGSFASKETADGLVVKLRGAGLKVMEVSKVQSGGKPLYRVRISPESTKEQAARLQPKVKEIAGTEGVVLKFP